MKQKQTQAILQSTLTLLVFIREQLDASGGAETPLFKAVKDQANLVGSALPNNLRMTPEAVSAIRQQVRAATALAAEEANPVAKEQATANAEFAKLRPALPKVAGQMVVLNPNNGLRPL